jgi:hypothetical protein
MPTSLPPRSYQGCAISSQVSWITLVGAGSDAPGREPSICQISTNRPMITSGGSTCVTKVRPTDVIPDLMREPWSRVRIDG